MDSNYNIDAVLEEFRKIGRDSEYCPESEARSQFEIALENTSIFATERCRMECPQIKYKRINRMMLHGNNRWFCTFCRNNGEVIEFYLSHSLKDQLGRICCPVLSKYICQLCGATGPYAHTIKYCPFNPNRNKPALITTLKSLRNSVGMRRHT